MENHLFPIKASNVSSNTIAIDAHHKFPQKIDQHCKVLYNMVQCSSRLAAAFCVVTLHNDIIMSDGLHGLVGKLFQKKINHLFVEFLAKPLFFTGVCGQDLANQGLFGAPNSTDLWSTWLTAYYGGRNISQHRNIASWLHVEGYESVGVFLENVCGCGLKVFPISS